MRFVSPRSTRGRTVAKRSPNLRKLARRQRWVLWFVLVLIVTYFAQIGFLLAPSPEVLVVLAIAAPLLQLAVTLGLVIYVLLLLAAHGTHWAVIVLCAVFMLAPCANLLLLFMINRSVTSTLRRAGLRVGLMGVKEDDLERVLNPALCTHCGYDLTGNVSGICPECGSQLERDTPAVDATMS